MLVNSYIVQASLNELYEDHDPQKS